MIDLRCHILDGTGCGTESFAESVEMCRQAVADGVRTIVATPRWEAQSSEPPLSFAHCQQKLEQLRGETFDALSFKLGFAMLWSLNLLTLVEQYGSKLALGGGRYILICLPTLSTPSEAEEVWNGLIRKGFNAVVSRPECSPALRHDPARLRRWVVNGVMLQIDAASVVGTHGREVQRFAVQCMREFPGSVVVASNRRDASARRPSLHAARQELIKKVGSRRVRMLMSETPAAILKTAEAKTDATVWAAAARPSRGLFAAVLRSFKPVKAPTKASYHSNS